MIPTRKEFLRIEPASAGSCDSCPMMAVWLIFYKDTSLSYSEPEAICWDCFFTYMRKVSDHDDPEMLNFWEKWLAKKSGRSL